MLIFNWVVGTGFAFLTFWYFSDHSWGAAVDWGLFYLSGLILPALWVQRTQRELRRLEVPIPKALRTASLYPLIVGIMMMVCALRIIAAVRVP